MDQLIILMLLDLHDRTLENCAGSLFVLSSLGGPIGLQIRVRRAHPVQAREPELTDNGVDWLLTSQLRGKLVNRDLLRCRDHPRSIAYFFKGMPSACATRTWQID